MAAVQRHPDAVHHEAMGRRRDRLHRGEGDHRQHATRMPRGYATLRFGPDPGRTGDQDRTEARRSGWTRR